MARQKTKKEKAVKAIPYYPELRELIPSWGFKNSTSVISYLLRQCNVSIMYDRIYTREERIETNVEYFKGESDEGFIFVMDVPDTPAIEVIHLYAITKDDMVKYLKLKVFS